MAHMHSVYDSDAHFSINPITRVLRNEASGKTNLIQYDHNSERFTFEIPRMIEGHDMSKCNVVRVHYINIDAKTKAQVTGVYEMDDMQVSPESDDVVICSWLISRNATQLVGSLHFVLCFSCVTDGIIDYAWNTAMYTGISVGTGIDNGEEVATQYPDVLDQWREELMSIIEHGVHPIARSNSLDGEKYFAHGGSLPTVDVNKISQVVFIPDVDNATDEPTLSINNGEHFPIRLRVSQDDMDTTIPVGMLVAGTPYVLTFAGDCWLVDSMVDAPSEIDSNPDNIYLANFRDALVGASDGISCGIPIIDEFYDHRPYGNMVIQRTSEEEEQPGYVEVPSVGMMREHIEDATPRSDVYVSLPDYINVKTNCELRVYFRNILSRDDVRLWIGYNDSLDTKYYDEYLTITAEAEGSYTLPWEVFDSAHNKIASGNLQIIATAKVPTGSTRVIVIGDSTVNAGTMTAKLAELYSADGATLTLLGTRGNGTHEGRSGWTAEDYHTKAIKGDIENPFYNGGFDFEYYMQNQGFDGVDAVVIQLGINDIFKFREHYSWCLYDIAEIEDAMRYIAESIYEYDSNIKIIINLPTTPNSDGVKFTESYGTTQLYWVYNRNIIRFAKELMEQPFVDMYNVIISASNCVLDTKTQIRDGVHPTEEGYNALGQRLYEVLISNIDGTAPVSLLDIMGRERVTTGISVLATDPHELDTTKCYDTSFGGVRSHNVSVNITSYTPLSKDSFSCQVSKNTGNGLEFPVQLEVGKTYNLSWTSDNANVRAYLMKYNADTTFNSYELLGMGEGTKTATITPEDGYIYSICFPVLVNNTLCTVSDISLTEQT